MWLLRVLVATLAVLGIAIALAPEPKPGSIVSAAAPRVMAGAPGRLPLAELRDRDHNIPTSLLSELELFRSWTAEHGVQPLELEFGPIRRVRYLGIIYQGAIFDAAGQNALYLRCSTDRRVKPVSVGGVNTTVTEAIVRLDPSWCRDGQIYLRMVGGEKRNIGVATPYQRSALAYLKQSYLGYVGFFLTAFSVLLAVFFAGGLAARRFSRGLDPVLGGLLAIGSASLFAFYVYAWTPTPAPAGLLAPIAFGLVCLAAWLRAPGLAASVWRAQRNVVLAWFVVGIATMSILHLAGTGSGAWEPAYRFAPAIWSSDHTLPMVLAEVARIGVLPQEGHVGEWSLSDRPPLLAGAYLLSADLLAVFQSNNDGPHLQPIALGVGGIAACSLWAATFFWALRRAAGRSSGLAILALAAVAVTPFALFNTAYTWPKLLGAAFSLAAAAYVFRRGARTSLGEAMTYGALAGFALLCHAASAFFLAPVSLIYVCTRLWRSPKALVAGAAVGLCLLGSWSAFKLTVLPSHDPLLAYALTGEISLKPDPLGPRLVERYRGVGWSEWLAAKAEVGAYLFTPTPLAGPLPLERPPAPPQADLPAQLRFWDFYALSAGNVALLILAASGLIGALAARGKSAQAVTAGRLILAAAGCYALFVVATFLPLFIHQFSYDAILAAALAGAIILTDRGRAPALLGLAALSALYTAAIWVAGPLGEVRTIDLAAAVALLWLAGSLLLGLSRLDENIGWRRVLVLTLALAAVSGAAIAWWPSAHILERGPERIAIHSEAHPSCIGAFDAVMPRKDGSWLAYGWAWDMTAGVHAQAVRVLDSAGAELGAAKMGQARPDVPAAFQFVPDAAAGWALDLPRRPVRPRAIAVLADGTECVLGGVAP